MAVKSERVISWAKLKLPVDISKIQEEASRITEEWKPHFNISHYEGEWTVLSLRAPGGSYKNIIPDAIAGKEYIDTPLLQKCPHIKDFLATFQCPKYAVRLLQLKAGSRIKKHRDYDLSFENGEARLHIPVFTNPAVNFELNDKTVEMNEGECIYINANLPHQVVNNGNQHRIHLVIDCQVNTWLAAQFDKAEKEYSGIVQNKEEIRRIINELKSQNTPAALTLAETLEQQLNE